MLYIIHKLDILSNERRQVNIEAYWREIAMAELPNATHGRRPEVGWAYYVIRIWLSTQQLILRNPPLPPAADVDVIINNSSYRL